MRRTLFWLMWIPGLFWLFPAWTCYDVFERRNQSEGPLLIVHAMWSSPQFAVLMWLLGIWRIGDA